MHPTTRRAIERLKADAISGASELLPLAVALLRQGLDDGTVEDVAREVVQAQPSMAPFWNAALAAMAGAPEFERFERRRERALAAVARVAAERLRPGARDVLHVVTWSCSGSVLACLRALAGPPLRVSCAEGRPRHEGRRMASALAAEGVDVHLYTDAAVAVAVAVRAGPREERVVLVGADAIAPAWTMNKVGTGMLAAAAARAGVPVYVVATRDKFVDARVARLLAVGERDPAEVWDGPPVGVAVHNPYFERVGIDLVSGVFTDAGLLAAGMIDEACRAASSHVTAADIERLSVGASTECRMPNAE